MKKTLTALALATFATSAYSNIYVQAEAGFSKLKGDSNTGQTVFKATSTNPRISIGDDNGKGLLALDYTHFGKLSSEEKVSGVNVKSEAKIQSIGVSGIYYFGETFQPYLGVRLAYNKIDAKVSAEATRPYSVYTASVKGEGKESSFGYGALAGLRYKVTDNVALNVGAEYNVLSSDFTQFGGRAGVSYKF